MFLKKIIKNSTKSMPKRPSPSEVHVDHARSISTYLQTAYNSPWIPITVPPKSDLLEQDAMYSYQMAPMGYLNIPTLDGRDDLNDRQNNGYRMQDSYGGYEDGGYGIMQNSVAFSALGFMSFLFFLKMIGDTITTLDTALPGLNKKRDSRSATFKPISLTQAEETQINIAKLLIAETMDSEAAKLIEQLLKENNQSNKFVDACLDRHLCELNRYLVKRYGYVGEIFGSILGEIFSKRFHQHSEQLTQSIMDATRDGQQGKTCRTYSTTCTTDNRIDDKNTGRQKNPN